MTQNVPDGFVEAIEGPCTLDYVVRRMGTFLGMRGDAWNSGGSYASNTSLHCAGDIHYEIVLRHTDRDEWFIDVTRTDLKP